MGAAKGRPGTGFMPAAAPDVVPKKTSSCSIRSRSTARPRKFNVRVTQHRIARYGASQSAAFGEADRQQLLPVGEVGILALTIRVIASETVQNHAFLEVNLRGGHDIHPRSRDRGDDHIAKQGHASGRERHFEHRQVIGNVKATRPGPEFAVVEINRLGIVVRAAKTKTPGPGCARRHSRRAATGLQLLDVEPLVNSST